MQTDSNSPRIINKKDTFLFDFLSFLFILSAPYLHFVDHQDFLFEFVNLLVVAGFVAISVVFSALLWVVPSHVLRALVVAILLLYFIDFQLDWIQGWGKKIATTGLALLLIAWILRRHLSLILVVVFGTIIVGTFGASIVSHSFHGNSDEGLNTADREADLPVYVHIILDEQMGIEGFDGDVLSQKNIKGEITKLFSKNKFRIFARAYSHYYDSHDSISSLLNLKTTESPDYLYSFGEASNYNWKLLKNLYFENILSKGYDINIYQSTYMNFCNSVRKKIKKCLTYNHYGTSSAALSGLKNSEKAKIVLSIYGSLSVFVKETQNFYRFFRSYLMGVGLELPDWLVWDNRLGPIPALPVFDTLIKDVAASPGGTMFFAHLLIPHYPYSVDSACQIRRPVLRWMNRSRKAGVDRPGQSNTSLSRLVRYEENILQIRCALSKLEKLFMVLKTRGTFEDAVIIVHGDHGSRIVLVEPRTKYKSRLSRQDYYDAFSTLYVIKSPGIAPGYDTRMKGLPELLRDSVSGHLTASATSDGKHRPFIFLRDDEESWLKVPMPEIPTVLP